MVATWQVALPSPAAQTDQAKIKPNLTLVNPKNASALVNQKGGEANLDLHSNHKIIKTRSFSTTCIFTQGKARVKKLAIFSGHFYGKSLENPAKTAKKMSPKHAIFDAKFFYVQTSTPPHF